MVDKWISNSLWKRCGYGKAIGFANFLAWAFAPQFVCTHPEFQFTATVFMSMAAQSSDLDDQNPGTSIQKEGHTLTPPSGWNSPEDPEAFGSAPSQSPSQAPVREPDCHEDQRLQSFGMNWCTGVKS